MRMSLLTNSLTGVGIRDLKTIADWAWENGICELDVGPAIPLDKEQFDAVLGEGKVSVGTMIYCRNFLSRDKEEAEFHCSALRDGSGLPVRWESKRLCAPPVLRRNPLEVWDLLRRRVCQLWWNWRSSLWNWRRNMGLSSATRTAP